MSKVLTLDSVIKCSHQGTVSIQSSAKLKVKGKSVLLKNSILNKSITGCKQTGSGVTPCPNVDSITAGEGTKLTVAGKGVMLETLEGTGAGNPKGTLIVTAVSQSKLHTN